MCLKGVTAGTERVRSSDENRRLYRSLSYSILLELNKTPGVLTNPFPQNDNNKV